ncbi:MAG: hypothetical protein UH239_03330 [Acutalibacteraceae bacterium]|nr:hypothetical protein [Acutalibacteraceae bacterium]
MENRLKNHIDILFKDMPQNENTYEIKDEILQNLIDKYYDLLNDGNDPETAYSIVVASIGDVRSFFPDNPKKTEELVSKQRKKSALLVSGAVMLYILSPIAAIIGDAIGGSDDGVMGVGFMFLMIAVATGMLIYNAKTKYKPEKHPTMVNEFKDWQSGKPSQKSVQKQISGFIWTCVVIVYFLISFLTGAWYITWLIFLIGLAVNQVVNLCISLDSEKEKEKEL